MAMKIIIHRPLRGDAADDTIDMDVDGRFIDPAPAPLAGRIFRGAILVAIATAGLALAALAIWFALILIPIALAAGAIAWAAWRWQLWRAQGRF